jgi:hypothetical protein
MQRSAGVPAASERQQLRSASADERLGYVSNPGNKLSAIGNWLRLRGGNRGSTYRCRWGRAMRRAPQS